MVIETVVDLTLQLGSFRNFDLMYTGAYRIRAQAYHKTDEVFTGSKSPLKFKKVYALPYLLLSSGGTGAECNFFELYEGQVDMTENIFNSSSFYVDYSDVFKEINQICVFRFTFENNVPSDVFLEFSLL